MDHPWRLQPSTSLPCRAERRSWRPGPRPHAMWQTLPDLPPADRSPSRCLPREECCAAKAGTTWTYPGPEARVCRRSRDEQIPLIHVARLSRRDRDRRPEAGLHAKNALTFRGRLRPAGELRAQRRLRTSDCVPANVLHKSCEFNTGRHDVDSSRLPTKSEIRSLTG